MVNEQAGFPYFDHRPTNSGELPFKSYSTIVMNFILAHGDHC